ncbi:co-chaperone GroES [Candidatus Berkelbacteria bacterium]|nr:co-chaperone GroES [Candidatus Berkelbacteria bacterium]
MIHLKPIGDRILVRPLATDEVTKSGIVLPDSAKEKSQEGEVLAVGSGKFEHGSRITLEVKKGDKVIFSKYGGDEITIDGEELKIIAESDILAIVNK